jgi:hypothetical protein
MHAIDTHMKGNCLKAVALFGMDFWAFGWVLLHPNASTQFGENLFGADVVLVLVDFDFHHFTGGEENRTLADVGDAIGGALEVVGDP